MVRQILLIDDDPEEHEIVCESLIDVGDDIECDYADDYSKAQELAKARKPDVILLDLNMPGVNGFEVLSRIKVDDRLNKIPVVVYSNGVDESVCEKALRMGAIGCIRKALDIPKLTAIMKAFFLHDLATPFISM